MFNFLPVSVKVNRGVVTISHIPSRVMERDIQKFYETSRINKYMFNTVGYNSISFNEFFALEVYFILTQLIAKPMRYSYVNVRVLKNIADALKENTWLRNIDLAMPDRLDFKQLDQMLLPPLPKQREFLEAYNKTVSNYQLRGMLLAAAVGAGKTITSLYIAACVKATRIVVVCPKPTVHRVWVETASTLYKKPTTHWNYDSGKAYNYEKIAIFHYEALDKALAMVRDLKTDNVTVILDESHNLNDMKAMRTQRFIDLCNELDASNVLLVSGTPIKAMSSESIPLFRAIDPLFTESTMERFKKIYAGNTNAATEILSHRLNLVSFKVEKAELNLDKPIFQELKIKIPNGDKYTLESIAVEITEYAKQRISYYTERFDLYKEIYDDCITLALEKVLDPHKPTRVLLDAEADFMKYRDTVKVLQRAHDRGGLTFLTQEMAFCNQYEKDVIIPNLESKEDRDNFKEAKTIVKYLKLKVQGECLGRILGRKRIEAHVDMVSYIDFDGIVNSTQKKTLVFTSYAEVIQACEKQETKLGFTPLSVYGKATSQLTSIVGDFASNPDLNPLNATYASLGTGVPLIMADTMIIINAPFRDYILQQTIGRIHRIGMTTQPRVFTCILDTGDKPNISSRSVDILKWSQDEIQRILNIESPYKLTDTDDVEAIPAMEELLMSHEIHRMRIDAPIMPATPFFNHW